MLDKLHMFIPFRIPCVAHLESGDMHMYVDLQRLGVPMQGEVSRDEQGALQVDYLRHPFESLPSSYTPMAFKIFHQSAGKRLEPGIELKASPAKLLQGHNVFGPTSIRKGAEAMLLSLQKKYPKLFSMLDIPQAQVYVLDCTYSSRLPNESIAYQVVDALTNVSNGHTKSRGDNYRSSAYFGSKKTRLKRIKAYLKHLEFDGQLAELKRERFSNKGAARAVKVMSDPRLQEWVKYLLRLEATVMHRWLERRGIPTKLIDLCEYQEKLEGQGRCLIQECWKECTKDLFAAFEGIEMKVINDETVRAALLEKHTRINRFGKPSESYALNLFRTYRSIKDYGWDATIKGMSRPTFYRHVEDICEAGLSKAALQKLHHHDRANNVIPLLRFVTVDFGAQRPHWYVEPEVA